MFPEVDANSPLLQNLNPEQRASVTLPGEHALILAGAGSGKTRVLTTRIAWLLATGQIGPGNVMAVTFTHNAAREMMTRLTAILPVNVCGMWIGTFHGLCNRFLRAHFKLANLPHTFQILDAQDQLSAISRLMKQHNVDEERFPAKETQWFIASCKEEGLRPNAVEVRSDEDRRKVEIYQLYEDQCQREGVVDFAELMLRSYELLRDNDPIREHYRRRFHHILIDDFQDTNKLQYAWIKMVSGEGNSVFAVGDDDQSIYAFRGARVGNMADFVREFSVRHQMKLEHNYRSYRNILDSANALIAHNKTRLGKNLRTDQGPGEPVRVYEAPTDLAEAQWMVEEVRHVVRGDGGVEGGTRRHEVAVLYRSNAQSRVLETALFNAGVPYRVFGGLRFFELAEIKHALAYLRLLENPKDDTSFLRVVNFPPRGIGARSIEQLQDAARAAGGSLHDAVGATTCKAGSNLTAFVARLDGLRQQTSALNLREVIELVLQESGLIEHYKAEREGADCIENLEELVNAAERFATEEGFGRDAAARSADEEGDAGVTILALAAFLAYAALDQGGSQSDPSADAVQLMTVHSARGLEFDCVFISGLEEGLFPHENSMSDHEGLEEERRLMYVAITRARKRLYLSYSQTRLLHGQTRYNIKSRFFDELPEAALKGLTPKNQNSRGSSFGYGAGYPSTRNAATSNAYGRGSETFASPPVPNQRAEPAQRLRLGMQVFHSKFGEGTVLTLEGSGQDARAQINFPRHGPKWLALSVAKLTPVS